MAKPPMPLSETEAEKEQLTHQIRFTDKVAPYNSDEEAWFTQRVAIGYCINGVAVPLAYKNADGEIVGTWDLNPAQKQMAQQLELRREGAAGDYAEQIQEDQKARDEEAAKVNESKLEEAAAAEGKTSRAKSGKG